MSVEIGDEAPDFELPSHTGDTVRLSDLRGKKPVALVFYPFTFTGVCEGELCRLRDDYAEFEKAGVEILAVSCDTKPAQKLWAEQQGWTFPTLSDFWPHGEVSKAYGVFDDKLGAARRATFVIDTNGKVVDKFESPDLATPRPAERYAEAVSKL